MSRLDDLDRAGTVAATLAAGASGRRVTDDRQDGWTTHHGRSTGSRNDTTRNTGQQGGGR